MIDVRGYKNAIKEYNEAIQAAADVPEALAPALLNRAMAEFKLENYGRALQDVEKSLSVMPGNVKAHYRYVREGNVLCFFSTLVCFLFSERQLSFRHDSLIVITKFLTECACWLPYTSSLVKNYLSTSRALLCALQLENFKLALQHYETGLQLLGTQHTAQARGHYVLFKSQKREIDRVTDKRCKYQSEKEKRLQAENERKRLIGVMLQGRRITMGLPLFSQQRRYSRTEPFERDGEWYWPVLLVYPEEMTSPGQGDQSDFLEEVAETTRMGEILQWVFEGSTSAPEWDFHRLYQKAEGLEMRYRERWTMELADADSEDEECFYGSTLPADEMGHWISAANDTRLCELMSRRNYTTPLFPVLYVVPKHVNLH